MSAATSDLDLRLSELLGRYMPLILAESARRRALSAEGLEPATLRAEHLPSVRKHLESGIRLFVDAAAQVGLMRELDALCGELAPEARPERVAIQSEPDISLARGRARALAISLGGGSFVAQRAATAASELARNLVAYAGGGSMELVPRPERSMLTIRAEDKGPGITDLESILEGRYRSKTGLGMGLRGVRRLAAHFDITTGPAGTRVEADIAI